MDSRQSSVNSRRASVPFCSLDCPFFCWSCPLFPQIVRPFANGYAFYRRRYALCRWFAFFSQGFPRATPPHALTEGRGHFGMRVGDEYASLGGCWGRIVAMVSNVRPLVPPSQVPGAPRPAFPDPGSQIRDPGSTSRRAAWLKCTGTRTAHTNHRPWCPAAAPPCSLYDHLLCDACRLRTSG